MGSKLDPKINKLIIVTHEEPDDDSVNSVDMYIEGYDLHFLDPKVELKFVPKGDRWEPDEKIQAEIDAGTTLMVHIDTGGGPFDHHDGLNNSAGEKVVNFHYGSRDGIPANKPWIREQLDLTIFRDTASEVGAEDERTAGIRAKVQGILNQAVRTGAANVPLICVVQRPGPAHLSELIHNMNGTDNQKMIFGLKHIEAWKNAMKKKMEIEAFFHHCANVETINEAQVLVVTECRYSSSEIRYFVRKHHYHGDQMIHLIITEFINPEKTYDPNERGISITIVHNNTQVRGVSELYDALKKMLGKNDPEPFKHYSGAIMTLKGSTLTLAQAVALAKEFIRLEKEAQPETDQS